VKQIRLNLWFDTEAEEAARFYVSVFKDARIVRVTNCPAVGQEVHGTPAGSVMTGEFEVNGQPFLALNRGPAFRFSEALSLEVTGADQAEIDYYWQELSEGGDPSAQQCGSLKDRYGLSWQIVPEGWEEMLHHPERERTERAFRAMLEMKKLDIAGLKRAIDG